MWVSHANIEIEKTKIKWDKDWKVWKDEKVEKKIKRLRVYFYKNELLRKD
jgi:hypothetical protein